MTPKELKAHKEAPKHLKEIPAFKHHKRNSLPKPLKWAGRPRTESTGLIDVSLEHTAFMCWRDGPIVTDRAFFGYLFCKLANGSLYPVFEFHWHPSHKPIHCKMPCQTELNYTDRTLPQAPELQLRTKRILDPQNHADRLQLIINFCQACGIQLPDSDAKTRSLWQ